MTKILCIIIGVVLVVGVFITGLVIFARVVTINEEFGVMPSALTGATGRPPEGGMAGVNSWAMFRGGQRLLGVSPGVLSDSLEFAWKFKTAGAVKSSPAILGGKVFVGSDGGNIYAVDLKSGEKLWAYKTEGNVEAGPCVVGGKVFVGSGDGFFYAIDAESGQEVWKYETGGKILGGANWVFAPGGTKVWIVVGSYDNKMYCLDSESGELMWEYQSDSYINGSPAIGDNVVVFGGCDAQIHVVSAVDGSRVKAIDTQSYIAASAAVFDGKVYIGNYDNVFMCADVGKRQTTDDRGQTTEGKKDDGAILWRYSDKEFVFFSSAAVNDEVVVVGSRDRRVHCINRTDGKVKWTFQTQGEVDSSPVICGDKVVVGSNDGRLYMIRIADGSSVWSYEIGESITSSPAVAAGMVVVGSDDGYVYAFESKQ